MSPHNPDRLLVKGGFKHFRRTYSRTEVKLGALVLTAIVAITVWIGWRGTLRPAELYGDVTLAGSTSTTVVSDGTGGIGLSPTPSQNGGLASVNGGRDGKVGSAIPGNLLENGWRETERSEFDKDNLYEKINGRADFFLSKGFVALHFATFANKTDEQTLIDLELYDMGSAAGSLSAFTAERKDGVTVDETDSGQSYLSRNALYLVQGKYYARALGTDESDVVTTALAATRQRLQQALAGVERSWALVLFVDVLKLDAGVVSFVGERAFSIEAAKRIWIAEIPSEAPSAEEGVIELFVSAHSNHAEAQKARDVLVGGFASYGSRDDSGSHPWVVDEFLATHATAVVADEFVIGVRSAPTREQGVAALARLEKALSDLDAADKKRVVGGASTPPSTPPVVGSSKKEDAETAETVDTNDNATENLGEEY